MLPEIKIFLAQFLMIALLGLQSINVNQRKKTFAAITSLCLGVTGFHVTGTIAQAYQQGMFSSIFLAYVLAGPCGIVFSISAYPVINKWFSKEK